VSGRFWMFVPVLLLGSTVAFAAWRIALVVNDPSFAAEEHAYERGLEWDEELERRGAQAGLGWSVAVIPPPAGAPGEVLVRVRTRDGAPVAGLAGSVAAFHNAFAAIVVNATLLEREPGEYVAALHAERAGLWQWRIALDGAAGAWAGSVRAEVAR
jgi:nitrogen fixation protein FixH